MYVTFLCCHKSGSHLYGFCTQHKGCRDPTTVCNSTCCNYRDLLLASTTCGTSAIVVVSPICPPDSVPATTASAPQRSILLARATDATTGITLYLRQLSMLPCIFRASGTGCYYLDPFFYYDLRNLIGTWTHQHDVYTKKVLSVSFFALTDLLTHPLCRCVCCYDQSQAACLGYCCRNVMICHPGHTALDDGIFTPSNSG